MRLRCKEREKTDRLGAIAPNLSEVDIVNDMLPENLFRRLHIQRGLYISIFSHIGRYFIYLQISQNPILTSDRLGAIAPNLSVFHVLIKSDAAAAATPTQNQKMFKIGAVYVVRSLHTHFEPNQTILAMFCTQPAKSPHLSTPPYISEILKTLYIPGFNLSIHFFCFAIKISNLKQLFTQFIPVCSIMTHCTNYFGAGPE